MVTLLAVLSSWLVAGAARAEIIVGYNGITLDTAQSDAYFYVLPGMSSNHIADQRTYTDDRITGSVLSANSDGTSLWGYRISGKDKVIPLENWGAWKWAPSAKETEGAPDRCTTLVLTSKRFRVKNKSVPCATATRVVRSYLSTGKAPRGYRCEKRGKGAKCEQPSVPNDDASAIPVEPEVDARLEEAWSNRIFLCGVADSFQNIKVYAQDSDTCDQLEYQDVMQTAADMGLISRIVSYATFDPSDLAHLRSPVAGGCTGGKQSLFCGEGDNCVALVNPLYEQKFAGLEKANWKLGTFYYRTASYQGC